MNNITDQIKEKGYWFELGVKAGRKQLLEELLQVLGLDEYIAEKIASHEEARHE